MYDIFYLTNKSTQFSRAQEVRSIDEARELSRTRFCWVLNGNNDYSNFDFLYEPPPWEAEQIHVWPSQHHQNGGTYLVPKIESNDFNYNHSAVTRSRSYNVVYANFCNPGSNEQFKILSKTLNITSKRSAGTLEQVKNKIQKTISEPTWIISSLNNNTDFNFNWHEDEWDPETLIWKDQHGTSAEVYLCRPSEGTEFKVIADQTVERLYCPDILYIDYSNNNSQYKMLQSKYSNVTQKRFFGSMQKTFERLQKGISKPTWIISSLNDYTDFDFTWHPDTYHEQYTQIWPSEYQDNGGTYLALPGDDITGTYNSYNKTIVNRIFEVPIVLIEHGNDNTIKNDLINNGHNVTSTRFFESNESTLKRIRKKHPGGTWIISSLNDYTDFNFNWHPNVWDEDDLHIWTSQHQPNGETYLTPYGSQNNKNFHSHTVERVAPAYPIIMIDYGNENKFQCERTRFVDTLSKTLERIRARITEPTWVISSMNSYSNFDFTWYMDESDNELTHVWSSQHQRTGGTFILQPSDAKNKYHDEVVPRTYIPPVIQIDHGNDSCTVPVEFTRARLFGSLSETVRRIEKNLSEKTWIISSLNDYRDFDFTWHPDLFEDEFTHTWPSQHQSSGGTFLASNSTNEEFNNTLIVERNHTPPIKYVDYGNTRADLNFKLIQLASPMAQRTRLMNSESETRHRIHTNCEEPTWYINSLNDYTDFDFTWHPNEFEEHMIHAYPSQHQNTGGTYLLPKFRYNTEFKMNFKKFIVPRTEQANILWIEFGDNVGAVVPISGVTNQTRFIETYYGTLKRLLRKQTSSYVWVVASQCDYNKFDFTWHPSEYEAKDLHVFPSNEQKYGDTFYINVQEFNKNISEVQKLEWMPGLNFQKKIVKRYPLPKVRHNFDCQIDAVKDIPSIYFMTMYQNFDTECDDTVTVNLWRPETRTIVPLNRGGSCVIVPRESINYLNKQMYDYPYIDKNHKDQPEEPLDIVFISNGEAKAEEHYKHLLECTEHAKNKVHRVTDVNGRLASMRAAADVSETAWYFVINAKLIVDSEFDWNWQPDRLQEKKHYIFYANNPYTGDTYGHMAIVAHNKQLVRTDVDWGLDFVMSYETAVVPILSGDADYADNAWDAWRTAFRETLKLLKAHEESKFSDIKTMKRIDKWLGANEDWNFKGANDARTFYNSVNGDMKEVQKCYEWKWLKNKFDSQYSN